eukprot:TRINITY_DN780186_c0_g1_i1.p1 TRINITY_DN780186_c0_g1~~TRINITY_DN780186_c0_g1_i1.p1  ORF type:complete len:542 (-),score=160.24 TRINITY_DN780186_c0_g1_i1:61-1686(-)
MQCVISKVVPLEPAICKSGHIFERRLLQKHIRTHKKCPVDGEDMEIEDIVTLQVKPVVQAKPPSMHSVPILLNALRIENEACAGSTNENRKQFEGYVRDLGKSSMELDASRSIIERLHKENDSLDENIVKLEADVTKLKEAVKEKQLKEFAEEEAAKGGLSPAIISKIESITKNTRKKRRKAQKKRKPANEEHIAAVNRLTSEKSADKRKNEDDLTYTFDLHSISKKGILCMSVDPLCQNIVATGGVDSNVIFCSTSSNTIVSKITLHKKSITAVAHHPNKPIFFVGSSDRLVTVWEKKYDEENNFVGVGENPLYTFQHSGAVVAISAHPFMDFFATASDSRETKGGTIISSEWALHDFNTGETLFTATSDDLKASDGDSSFTDLKIHPDGTYVVVSCKNGTISLWDITRQSCVFQWQQRSGINSISFSENGWCLASGGFDGSVCVWDLRTTSSAEGMLTKQIQIMDESDEDGVTALQFDPSTRFLVVGGKDVRIFNTHDWTEVRRLDCHSDVVTDLFVWNDCNSLLSCSKDRFMKMFSSL